MTDFTELTNFQLYKKVRTIIVSDATFNFNRERMLEKLYKECRKRHPRIYDRAVHDALIMIDGFLFPDQEQQIGSVESITAYTTSDGVFVAAAGTYQDVEGKTFKDLIPTPFFKIKIIGDSMIDAGILPNCFVLVQPTSTYKNLDVCLVNIDGAQMVKMVSVDDGQLWLYSRNQKYQPMRLEEYMQWEVQGVVKDILVPLPDLYKSSVQY